MRLRLFHAPEVSRLRLRDSKSCRSPNETLEFTRPIAVLPFTPSAVRLYFDLRREFPRRGKQDLKIAATVLEHFGVLVTRNRQDFESIPQLELADWSVDLQVD